MVEQVQSQVFRSIGFDVLLATTDARLLPRTLGMLAWVSIDFHNNIEHNWPKLREMRISSWPSRWWNTALTLASTSSAWTMSGFGRPLQHDRGALLLSTTPS